MRACGSVARQQAQTRRSSDSGSSESPCTHRRSRFHLAADPMSVSRYPVVVFDLDGTLVRNTAVLAVLADAMGHGSAIAELEQRFRAGEISNRVIADTAAAWFTGMDPDELWQHLEQAPWIAGIEATLETLLEAGCDLSVTEAAWRPSAVPHVQPHPVAELEAILVSLPGGAARKVLSKDGGKSWE